MDKTPQNYIEWQTLQQAYDKYEFGSLAIKLLAVSLTFVGFITNMQVCLLLAVVGMLWLQDGIWKTFQARFEVRLLQIETESGDTQNNVLTAPNFNIQWQKQRPGTVGLIKAYIVSTLKPTVAVIYLLLGLVIVVKYIDIF